MTKPVRIIYANTIIEYYGDLGDGVPDIVAGNAKMSELAEHYDLVTTSAVLDEVGGLGVPSTKRIPSTWFNENADVISTPAYATLDPGNDKGERSILSIMDDTYDDTAHYPSDNITQNYYNSDYDYSNANVTVVTRDSSGFAGTNVESSTVTNNELTLDHLQRRGFTDVEILSNGKLRIADHIFDSAKDFVGKGIAVGDKILTPIGVIIALDAAANQAQAEDYEGAVDTLATFGLSELAGWGAGAATAAAMAKLLAGVPHPYLKGAGIILAALLAANIAGEGAEEAYNKAIEALRDLGVIPENLFDGLANKELPSSAVPGMPGDAVPAHIPEGVMGPFQNSEDTASPVLIDLDSDGVEATEFDAETTTTFFDIDGDGFAEQTAWAGSDDGLLVRDLNENGVIDDASELFGSPTVDGFALLAQLDSNNDLLIDAADEDFDTLLIWKDANGDAMTQDGELETLGYWDIKNIVLASVAPGTTPINGNPVTHTATVTFENNTTATAADVWFVHDNTNTYYVGDYTFDLETLRLPTYRGYGTLPDLHIAMSQNGDLKELVEDFTTNWSWAVFADMETFNAEIEEILLNWADVQELDPDSRGGQNDQVPIDARHLAFLEAFVGRDYFNTVNGGQGDPQMKGWGLLHQSWYGVLNHFRAGLMVQVGADALFDGNVAYNPWTGEIAGDLTLSEDALLALVPFATDTGAIAGDYWVGIAGFIDTTIGLENLTGTEEGWLDAAVYASDPGLIWQDIVDAYSFIPTGITDSGTGGNDTVNGTSYGDTLYGNAGNDTVNGGSGNDTLYGGDDHDTLNGGNGEDILYGEAGNDVLNGGLGGNFLHGGAGNDTYVYDEGDDVISDESGTDIIALPDGITPGDVAFLRVNLYNLMIVVDGMGTIEIDGFYFNPTNEVETLDFYDPGDGTINLMALTDVPFYGTNGADGLQGLDTLNDTLYGLGGDDVLEGRDGDDIMDGGAGNDILTGYDGDDSYVMSLGYDVAMDAGSGSDDRIIIPANFDAGDVQIFGLTSNHAIIHVMGLGQMELYNQFYQYDSTHYIERIVFANGIDSDIVLSGFAYRFYGTAGNDTLYGASANADSDDVLYGLGGDDTLNGDAGNETMYGGDGNDTFWGGEGEDQLYGGAGDDTLYGQDDDDTYFYEGGYDTIHDDMYAGVVSTDDVIVLPEGIDPEDVKLVQMDGGSYVDIVHDSTAIIRLSRHVSTIDIETLLFDDSTSWNLANVVTELHGTSGGETLYGLQNGGQEKDGIYGYAGNDVIYGYAGNDILSGGDGEDTLYGGSGADTFLFEAASAFNDVDTIADFVTGDDDVIDIADLLDLYTPGVDALTDFVQIITSGADSLLKVDANGGGNSFVTIATIAGVTGLTDEAALVTAGNLIVA